MSEVIQRNRKEVEDIAAGMGLVAMIPGPYEVQLDMDGPVKLTSRVAQVIEDNGISLLNGNLITVSKSGNSHMYLRSNVPLLNWHRICIQACLGSDPVREVLSLKRMMEGSDTPTALFETAEMAEKVKQWRKQCGLDGEEESLDTLVGDL